MKIVRPTLLQSKVITVTVSTIITMAFLVRLLRLLARPMVPDSLVSTRNMKNMQSYGMSMGLTRAVSMLRLIARLFGNATAGVTLI